MCLGNRAESSVHYINSQLRALWENAQHCAIKHNSLRLKPEQSEVEYAICLREFYGLGKHDYRSPSPLDLAFAAVFGPPHLEFVCNHEVILYLDFEGGHFHYDELNGTSVVSRGHHQDLAGFKCAFRLDFSTFAVENISSRLIGSRAYDVNMIILDIASASFCQELSTIPLLEIEFSHQAHKLKTLIHHITKSYLGTLKRAGLHVLHSLPNFNNLISSGAHIDYSVISQQSISTHDIFGIKVEEINTYLKGLWLESATFIDQFEDFQHHHHFKEVTRFYLAEHRSVWEDALEDINFHLYFGPMQIQALCKREVVLYFNVQDVHYYFGGGFTEAALHTFSNWKIAVLVDVEFVETENGCVRRVKLNLSTARFCEHLSFLEGVCEDIQLFIRMKTTLIRYITRHYLAIVEQAGHYWVYHHDKRRVRHVTYYESEEFEEEEESHECWCTDVTTCGHGDYPGYIRWGIIQRERSISCHTHEYDSITAITQGSINLHFKTMWERARRSLPEIGSKLTTWSTLELEFATCLAEWSVLHADYGEEVFFSAKFDAPQVQLICSEGSRQAVIYINLTEGHLKLLQKGCLLYPGSESYSFSSWRIAFILDLKLKSCSNEYQVSQEILKLLERKDHEGFQQLFMNLSNARFCLERSHIPGLIDESDHRLLRNKHHAVVYYLKNHYFQTLLRAGHHVLYTLPLTGHSRFSLTSVDFQIYPFMYGAGQYIDELFGIRRTLSERNMIVFVGMTEERPLPLGVLPYCGNWVFGTGKEYGYGTVCISRLRFLEGTVLEVLAQLNRHTTIVPRFSGIDGGKWVLDLTTWDRHEFRKNRVCGWREVQSSLSGLAFEWKNREDWRYEHDGDSGANGHYHVKCTTHNTLAIPTEFDRGSCTISFKGSVHLQLSYTGPCKDWSSDITASWSAGIRMATDSRQGLHIHMSTSEVVPDIQSSLCVGDFGSETVMSAVAQVKEQLPDVIDFSEILMTLKASFNGVWTHLHMPSGQFILTSPCFTRRGDLMLELVPHATHSSLASSDLPGFELSSGLRAPIFKANGKPHQAKDTSPPPPNYSPTKLSLAFASKAPLVAPAVTKLPLPESGRSSDVDPLSGLGNLSDGEL